MEMETRTSRTGRRRPAVSPPCPQGKGSMPTYWLLEKEGGVSRTLEIEVPGFLDPNQQPEFMNTEVYWQK